VIQQLQQGFITGTLLLAGQETLVSRKQWLAALPPKGVLTLDDGAVRVLKKDGRSLLPVGVKNVQGEFTRGELVACADGQGNQIARGLINYNTEEATAICGCSSSEIKRILGYEGEQELIHRDNMVIV
jgi:glutamate 5-kinase